MQHFKDIDGIVHVEGPSLDGDEIEMLCLHNTKDQAMTTSEAIDCGKCIQIIEWCRSVHPDEIRKPR